MGKKDGGNMTNVDAFACFLGQT